MIEKISNFINGNFEAPKSNKYLDVFEPATGYSYAEVPNSNSQDIDLAVKAAKNAFPLWSEFSIGERSIYLKKIADEIQLNLEAFAAYESRDTGKPISLAKKLDIPRSISNFTFFIDFIDSFKFNYYLNSNISKNYIQRQALGVVACISPWNLPLYLFTWKIVPALIVGNTVIAKPSEITPYSAFKLAEICQKIQLPPGVLNILNGDGESVGNPLVKHPEIKAISFTGGTSTGKKISQATAKSFKKISLEMGGKNPAIIFADCDYDKMLETVIKSSFTNQGQICLCSSRIIIEQSIYEKFKIDFCNKASELVIGDPKESKTQFGAISSKEHFDKINYYLNLIEKGKGHILKGGRSLEINQRCQDGWFIEPTIIEGLSPDSKLIKEEIFGPVVTLHPFTSEAEAIKISNETEYGLSATIWTENSDKSQRVAKKVDAGVIWINCWMVRDLRTPFGGLKQSGLGKEGGSDALEFFTEKKNICTPS